MDGIRNLPVSISTRARLRRRAALGGAGLTALLSTLLLVALTVSAGAQDVAGDDEFELRWHGQSDEVLAPGSGSISNETGTLTSAWADSADGHLAIISIESAGVTWSLGLSTGSSRLAEGTFTGTVGELDGSGAPLLAVNVDGRECENPVGVFEILDAEVAGESVESLAADFQVGCGGDAAAGPQLVGALRINSLVEFDEDRSISGRIRYTSGFTAAEGRACAISATTARNSRCALADRWGRYEIPDLEPDNYFVSFTAPDGRLDCFDGQTGCGSATYLTLREPISVNTGIDARLEVGCAGAEATITGTEGDDVLEGTDGRDVIVGLGGDDLIIGLGGNDLLCGGMGNDSIVGGTGDDILNGGFGDDMMWGQAGEDVLSGFAGADTLRGGPDDDQLSGDYDDDDLKGGSGDDEVHGDDGDDTASGGTGDDVVTGGAGADSLNGNGGSDDVHGGTGNDIKVFGGPRPDLITGGSGNDFIKGLAGADTIDGGEGDDVIRGGKQNDLVAGGAGFDDCNGGAGDFDSHNGCEVLALFEIG